MTDPDSPPDEAPAVADEKSSIAPPTCCSQCGAGRLPESDFCGECGFVFADDATTAAAAVMPDGIVGGRYRLTQLIGERGGVARFRGEDVGTPETPIPVVIVRQIAPSVPATIDAAPTDDELTSAFDFDLASSGEQATEQLLNPAAAAEWPGVAWEQATLLRAAHLSLPRLIDTFVEDGFTYLVEEVPSGVSLWDAWERDGATNRDRFWWLMQLAQALDRLHAAGAILEGLRPDMVVVSPTGVAILADLTDLLPLPLPGEVPLRGGFSTAPELLLNIEEADERADLYAFGALVYALSMGRELSDLDFTLTGMPKPYLERVPDANPFLARLLAKTFVRDIAQRFPTEDGELYDRTGFKELLAALDACRLNLDRVKLDVAAWSTTGIIRTGNEDGVAAFHVAEGRLDDSDEGALVLLADGMGGMESGEVAAEIALRTLAECLLQGPPFGYALPVTPLPATPTEEPLLDPPPLPEAPAAPVDPSPASPPTVKPRPGAAKDAPERTADSYAERITAALREANRRIFEEARAHPTARGMGCTAEVVLVDGPMAVVGHVGDSRVYRMRRGKLAQVTRDQTVVARMIEFGQLTEAEAEAHPRRSELQQAVGGRPDVYPDVYAMALEPGDWILVCSDGLSNQISLEGMQALLREARNAERAARRLINMALADGAIDNVSVAVIRAA